jgi:MFS family permease
MFNWKISKQEWHLFAICLIPGLTWGLVGLVIARYVFGLTQASRVYEVEIISTSIVIGMTFGVSSYAVNWIRRGCPKFTQFRDHLVESMKCVLYGIYCSSLGFMVMGFVGLFFGQVIGIMFAIIAPFLGLMASFFTVIPASLLMRPLLHLLLEKWFMEFQNKWQLEHQNKIPSIKNP